MHQVSLSGFQYKGAAPGSLSGTLLVRLRYDGVFPLDRNPVEARFRISMQLKEGRYQGTFLTQPFSPNALA